MRTSWRAAVGAAVLMAVAGLQACERASSTARARSDDSRGASYAPRDAGEGASSSEQGGGDRGERSYASRGDRDGYGDRGEGRSSRSREPTPTFKGEPLWSDNRRYSAEENARYHCGKSGPDIGAAGYDDCLTKVHAFIDHPPSGVETLTRSNGDRLLYDAKANLFVVARKDGAPRTFFKPRDGASYWAEQKTREAEGGGYGRRSRSSSDEGAGT